MNKSSRPLPPGDLNPELAYLRGEVETAEPLKLLLLLYNRLIGELAGIRDRIGTKAAGEESGSLPADIVGKFELCRSILRYLMESLDPGAGEVATQLMRMYQYFQERILTAQMEKDGRVIADILPMIETIREGWGGIASGEKRP